MKAGYARVSWLGDRGAGADSQPQPLVMLGGMASWLSPGIKTFGAAPRKIIHKNGGKVGG